MRILAVVFLLCVGKSYAQENSTDALSMMTTTMMPTTEAATTVETPIGCVCGVFLSGQFTRGSKERPNGNPALLHEHPDNFQCNSLGNKQCINKCLDIIVKHLPNSPTILCGAVDREVLKERAYLFIKNCKDDWINTNLSAGREYCCKNGMPYKCPIIG